MVSAEAVLDMHDLMLLDIGRAHEVVIDLIPDEGTKHCVGCVKMNVTRYDYASILVFEG